MDRMTDKEYRETLLKNVKKEVKQIMEEAVTRKFVHEESSSITTLCAAVELCLSHGLRRRALGLFKTNSTTALLHKIAKSFEPAALISHLVEEAEGIDGTKRSSSSGDSLTKQSTLSRTASSVGVGRRSQVSQIKYLWIRLALFEKVLAKIIEHLVDNSNRYYDREALVANPVHGPILASLLMGPCALDYSKMKTQDHYWTDPPADELVQRHRISSVYCTGNPPTPPTQRRPGLNFRKPVSVGSSTDELFRTVPVTARDYVESLHQNNKTTLLYGKNNVLVQSKENTEPMLGYLSLHQTVDSLIVKWTPNQLMNGNSCCNGSEDGTRQTQPALDETKEDKSCSCVISRRRSSSSSQSKLKRSYSFNSFFRRNSKPEMFIYWDFALTIHMEDIIYVHCHQRPDTGGTVVLVGQDGVQRPPIHFPRGGHLLAFLSCLENGLLPRGQLDPPLWSQRGKVTLLAGLAGKVFPRLKRRGLYNAGSIQAQLASVMGQTGSGESSSGDDPAADLMSDDVSSDYVFRIITSNGYQQHFNTQEMLDGASRFSRGSLLSWGSSLMSPRAPDPSRQSSKSSSTSSNKSSVLLNEEYADAERKARSSQAPALPQQTINSAPDKFESASLQMICDTMKRQIMSRAFYGWLAHCRHLRTVRTHLSGLVNAAIVDSDKPSEASPGLSMALWRSYSQPDGKILNETEIYRLTYFGGMEHCIRKEVWPFLLGHYVFESTLVEREEHDRASRHKYETTMSEWLCVEAIVVQKDKETVAAQLAKLSSESTNGEIPLVGRDHNLSNDVFDDNISISSADDTTTDPEVTPHLSAQATFDHSSDNQDAAYNMAGTGSSLADIGSSVVSSSNTSNYLDAVTSPDDDQANADMLDADSHSRDKAAQPRRSKPISIPYGYERNLVATPGAGASPWTQLTADDVTNGSVTPMTPNALTPSSELNDQTRCGSITPDTERFYSPVNGRTDSGDEEEDEAGTKEEPEEKRVSVTGVGSWQSTFDRRISGLLDHGYDRKISTLSTVSVASSIGGIYSNELLDTFALNLHRIDKDVLRCDRNYAYFSVDNLEKLRNVMCTYVWEHLDTGYVQGMCDLVAPLLVIFDDESKTYSCFSQLMLRMGANFPHGGAMDSHFANMRSLIQILDSEMFDLMHQNGDYTHFYFCYRWFLLDFKRELLYDDVFLVWESIWAARHTASAHFVLFIALALVRYYRDIILDNNMDFTDIIKFFNEMAERHNAQDILKMARELVYQLQVLIENK